MESIRDSLAEELVKMTEQVIFSPISVYFVFVEVSSLKLSLRIDYVATV